MYISAVEKPPTKRNAEKDLPKACPKQISRVSACGPKLIQKPEIFSFIVDIVVDGFGALCRGPFGGQNGARNSKTSMPKTESLPDPRPPSGVHHRRPRATRKRKKQYEINVFKSSPGRKIIPRIPQNG
jgi:hypothetical protein